MGSAFIEIYRRESFHPHNILEVMLNLTGVASSGALVNYNPNSNKIVILNHDTLAVVSQGAYVTSSREPKLSNTATSIAVDWTTDTTYVRQEMLTVLIVARLQTLQSTFYVVTLKVSLQSCSLSHKFQIVLIHIMDLPVKMVRFIIKEITFVTFV